MSPHEDPDRLRGPDPLSPRAHDHLGLDVLDPTECRDLLVATTIGRVGISVDALPVILPVNYRMLDDAILIRTAEGSKLSAAWKGAVVAFEIDDYDPLSHTGWSVLVQGTARVLTAPGELARARRMPLEPWAHPDEGAFVAISCDLMSGRRIAGWHRLPGLPISPPPTRRSPNA
ncbi:MAG TPA: pyridoxamine 5'-phosphate oxidase family protein [Acidimicrobiales bacterium]|nr:pyridoxamine 5'-phosphate oxidase family protein [Acidimicrobiales bacterium]